MITHYFKIAFRNLKKHKVFSILNITGLAIGMAGSLMLLLWIENQLSVDQFHRNRNNLYKIFNKSVAFNEIQCSPLTYPSVAPSLKKEFPELTNFTRITETNQIFRYADNQVNASGNIVDPAFLQMFSFPLVQGNGQSSLKGVRSIIITETFAKKLFGNRDPINKPILTNLKENFIVTGIMKDLPNNTQFKFDFLLPWSYYETKTNQSLGSEMSSVNTFIELYPNTNIDLFNKKVARSLITQKNTNSKVTLFLYPLGKLWLQADFKNGNPVGGGIDTVRMMGMIAGIILLIACINFMNLSTARSEKRAKEVGMRKIIGAQRISIIWQFLGESVFLSLIAGVLALCMVELTLPLFNGLTEKTLKIEYTSPLFWLAFIGFILLTGVLAGSYPAFYLSSFKPLKVIKGIFKSDKSFITPRKILVVFQFSFAIILINFTILLQKQLTYIEKKEPGYIKKNLAFISNTNDLRKNYQALKNELLSSGTVLSISKSNTPVTKAGIQTDKLEWTGKNTKESINVRLMTTENSFVQTNGVKLLSGRDIDCDKFPADSLSCLINEAAVTQFRFSKPLGEIIKYNATSLTIVGIVKDFVTGSPLQEIAPMIIKGTYDDNFINIRLNNNHTTSENIKSTESILKKYNPNYITELELADEDYARKIKGLTLSAMLTNIFTGIAVFISCLGLFGLVTFTAESKTKEIGIRKVLGASIASVTTFLLRDFIKLVAVSIMIASPLAWIMMNAFLRPFYYRVDLSWKILIIAGTLALFISFITIISQSINAAMKNPANSLRTE